MAVEPVIPEYITVHLGAPQNSAAENVTISFPDYIKNVASSELYPTWPEAALRANIYAIISFTLNRIFTEWYPSQGYDFDITNSTQYDQSFVKDRDIYEPINTIVDEIFNNYISRQGNVEPLFAVYCDGREVADCGGLTQWGSVALANQGLGPYDILTRFYGNDIDLVMNAPVGGDISLYPGTTLSIGDGGNDVSRLEIRLNRISNNYPAIPKLDPTGIYSADTAEAVRKFQEIFNLPQTGVVDKATWYKINYIYSSVKRLAQLNSEGLTLEEVSGQFPQQLTIGDTGEPVNYAQYILAVIGAYYNAVLPVDVTGTYDENTAAAVRSFQQVFGLEPTGIIDERTWDDIYRAYAGIVENVPISAQAEGEVLYPGRPLAEGTTSEYVRVMQEYLSYIHQTYPDIPDVSATGYFGPVTRNAVTAFQRRFGLNPVGAIGAETWNAITNVYNELRFGYQKKPGQNPGYTIG